MISLSGCAQKTTVSALQPAEVDRMADTKKIAVTSFSYDNIGLATKIESEIARKKVNHKNYFTIIDRTDIEKVLKEQRFQKSGLVDKKSSIKIGKIIGAQAIVSGEVSTASMSRTPYYERRLKCADKKCKKMYEYNVRCYKQLATLSAQIKIVDVEHGDIIYADTLTQSSNWRHCSDDSRILPSKKQSLNSLANVISKQFADKLAPKKINFSVILLDDPIMDYTNKQEDQLEYALVYIEHGRYKKAERLLSDLLESTSDKSFVAAYNLGVVKEIQGELEKAESLYDLADSLMIEPNEELDMALRRINNSISSNKKATSQINR